MLLVVYCYSATSTTVHGMFLKPGVKWFVCQKIKMEESTLCTRTTACWRPRSARDQKPQNGEQHPLEFTRVLMHVHRTAQSSPNAHIFFIAFTGWASLQLVSSFINCVLCERGFPKLWWSAHTHSHKCCSHYPLARSRLDSISFIYFPAGKCAVVLVQSGAK